MSIFEPDATPATEPPDPLLLDFPDQFETERLLIRAPQPGDGPAVHDAILESLDNLKPWMVWAQQAPSLEETESNIRQAAADFQARKDLRLLIFRKSDGLLVGSSGLHRIDWRVPKFEIGYWARRSLVGMGYVTESVCGIADFAFRELGAHRLEIRCDARNERSANVAERAGFTLEGRLRADTRDPRGILRDTLIYSRLSEDTNGP